ncbi:piggyBac transposable element-derived protein 4-like [Procambarus clarkii]|uniref:piggyBac transposable element-derived protein 4-like n=1 Tax=Procambarus clarkii TaxID=6728 RepID=UPI00374477BF
MDRGKGQSTSTPKKDSEMTKEEKLSELYKRFSNVKLTPSKIPDLLDRLSDVEADAEGKERQSDFSSDNEGTASSDEFDSSSTEESSEGIEDEAADVGRPKAPVRRRAGRLQQPNPDAAWSTDNTPPIVGSFSATPGITVPVPITPLQFVQLFLTRALIEFITVETNRYARQFIQNASRRTMRLWKEVSVKEMARYLALSILMGIARLPTMRMYWQTSRLWHMRTFNVFMTAKRFQHIAQFFHTYNQFAIPPNNKNRMIKLSTIITYLTNKFGSYYVPNQALSLDEGTMSWRGRLSFKVYNPNKPDKYGVKLYMLAEVGTGYIIDFEVYSGVGKTTVETVMGLMRPLLNKGYHLYMDNYYNSVHLTELLRENGVYTCGTLRLQRGAPKELQQLAKGKFAVDQTIFRRKDNTFVILWKDKRVVSVITNCHNADTQEVQRRKRVKKRDGTSSVQIVTVNKPTAICDYNNNMKGVDHFDQMVKYYRFTRKSHKWTKKITFYFLQMAIHNAYVMYKITIIETVTSLMRPLLNKGHHLYMDNYYNSVTLTEKLREVGVYTCGTIRLLRGAPKGLQQLAKSKIDVDTTVYRRKDNTFILLWKDKRVVSMITNLHNADTKKVQKIKRVRRADGTMTQKSA